VGSALFVSNLDLLYCTIHIGSACSTIKT